MATGGGRWGSSQDQERRSLSHCRRAADGRGAPNVTPDAAWSLDAPVRSIVSSMGILAPAISSWLKINDVQNDGWLMMGVVQRGSFRLMKFQKIES